MEKELKLPRWRKTHTKTEEEKKISKKLSSRKYNRSKVTIQFSKELYETWNDLKYEHNMKTNDEFGRLLIESWKTATYSKRDVLFEERKAEVSGPDESEPEHLMMECEPINDEESPRKPRGNGTSTTVTSREAEKVMKCESVIYPTIPHGKRRASTQTSLLSSGKKRTLVHSEPFTLQYIHGIPVNRPFKAQYSSAILNGFVESKVYVVVEFSAAVRNPVQIEIVGDIEEKGSGRFDSKIVQNFDKSCIRSRVDLPKMNEPDSLCYSLTGNLHDECEIDSHFTESYTDEIIDDGGTSDIVADILNDVIDKVVKKGKSMKRKKRKSSKDLCSTPIPKVIKIEDCLDETGSYRTRTRSKGFRMNYANFDDFSDSSDTSEVSDFDEIMDDINSGDDSEPQHETEDETKDETENGTGKPKGKVKKEDPDYDPIDSEEDPDKPKGEVEKEDSDYDLSDSEEEPLPKKVKEKKKKDPNFIPDENDKQVSEHSGDPNDKTCYDVNSKIVKKKRSHKVTLIEQKRLKKLQKLKERSERITVKLSDHTDKYYIEDQVSFLMQDRKKSDSEKSFQLLVCSLCRVFRTEEKTLMETHLENHLNGDLFCQKCDFQAATLNELRQHKEENHKPLKKCKFCSTKENQVTFKHMHEYKNHYLENHKDAMCQCSKCGKYFLNSHLISKHDCYKKAEVIIQCDLCGKEMQQHSLQRHKESFHFNVRPFPCSQCKYSSKSRTGLREHVQAKHEGVHNHKCDLCDFTCVRPTQLVSHKRTHTGYKPYKCDKCPYAAAWNVQLKDHRKLHEGMAPLAKPCEVCQVVVKEGTAYKMHLKKEHGQSA